MRFNCSQTSRLSRVLLAIIAILLAAPWTNTAGAGVYVDTPERLWPNGVVTFTFQKDPQDNDGVCVANGQEMNPCNPTNGNADCAAGETCVAAPPVRIAGICRDGTFAGIACNRANGNADCPGGGTCDPARAAANMCEALKVWSDVATLTFREAFCSGPSTCGICNGGTRDGSGCDTSFSVVDCPGGTCQSLNFPCVSSTPTDFIRFRMTVTGVSNSESIGRKGGEQKVSIREDGSFPYGLVHESGHALAFYHQQERTDRDNYMNVRFCLMSSGTGNFCKTNSSLHWPRNDIDFDSIMMYPLCAFSICRAPRCTGGTAAGSACCSVGGPCPGRTCVGGIFDGDPCTSDLTCTPGGTCEEPCVAGGGSCGTSPTCPAGPDAACACSECPDIGNCSPVSGQCNRSCVDDFARCAPITLKPPYDSIWAGNLDSVGQRDHLSEIDQRLISFLYPQPNWRFMELNYSPSDEDGTFHDPYVSVDSMLDLAPSNILLFAHPATYPRPSSVMSKPMTITTTRGSALIR